MLKHVCISVYLNYPHKKELVIKFWSLTAQKIKFSTKDLFSKCDQIRRFLRI